MLTSARAVLTCSYDHFPDSVHILLSQVASCVLNASGAVPVVQPRGCNTPEAAERMDRLVGRQNILQLGYGVREEERSAAGLAVQPGS